MSDMRHHAVFRHREFASFLRLRRHLPPSQHPSPPPYIVPTATPFAPPSIALPPLPALPSLAPAPLPPPIQTHLLPYQQSQGTPSSATILPLAPARPTPSTGPVPASPFPLEGVDDALGVSAFAKSSIGSGRKRPREGDALLASAASAKSRRNDAPVVGVFAPVTSPTAVANVVTPRSVSIDAQEFDARRLVTDGIGIRTQEIQRTFGARSGSESEEPDESHLTPGFDCELCNTRFYRKHHLERHIQNIHEGQRPWTCELCGFAFHQKPNLERHIMTVHEEQRPFRCNVCEMSFGRKGVLKKHVQMVHEHSRKFECETCKISFGLKSDLKRHVQSVHQKKRPFVCEVCSASFGRRSDLKRHTLSLHPGAEVPSKRNSGPSSSGQDTS